MKDLRLEPAGFAVLELEEQHQVNGGVAQLFFGILGGLYVVYNFGKIVGHELYELSN
jgi:hypothetical protein